MFQFSNILKKSYQLVKPIFLESLCLSCGQNSNQLLCRYCYKLIKKLTYPNNACQTCGNLIIKNTQCDQCLLKPPPWQSLSIAFYYDSLIQNLFQSFKFNHNFKAASFLCEQFSQTIMKKSNLKADIIIPVPIHRQRNITRGYNQSIILANALSKALNIPLNTNYIKRSKYTKAQTLLEGKARKDNLKDAFSIRSKKTYQHIIVVDDIITTGSTLTSFCNTLSQAYNPKIQVVTFAKPLK
ncbi:ComF family protein [Thiotrichales bacterium 19X7-9]|nr:ComF family protein [Thiotrichales bacterium 19X7-9]